MADTEMNRPKSKRNVPWIVVACLLTLIIAVTTGIGSAFFFAPLLLLAAIVGIFYFVMRHVSVRNPLYDARPDTQHKWADGQPIGRSNRFEIENEEIAAEQNRFEEEQRAEHDRIAEECREQAARNRPEDYQGPPPIVPFP